MDKLAILFTFLQFLSFLDSKLLFNHDVVSNEILLKVLGLFGEGRMGEAWVVDFRNGLDGVMLRQATGGECEMLRARVGRDRDGPSKPSVVKKDDPCKTYGLTREEKRSIENELSTALNKFLYAIRDDPDTLLTDSGDNGDSYLSVYFIGHTTCLTVTSGRQQWHYVVRPSPLPSWFHEEHDRQLTELDIPEKEKYELFKGLLSLISNLNSHPV